MILFGSSKKKGRARHLLSPEEIASGQAPKVKQATVEVPHDENPTLYEICLRTQQALERHIKMDRKEKVHLAIEINLLHNTARQALLVAKEEKRRSWVLLRKHYTRKQLHEKGIEKEYDYIDALLRLIASEGLLQCFLRDLPRLICYFSNQTMC